MKHFRQFGAVLLLLVSCVAPAMSCVVPGSGMTVEDRTCCSMMHGDCGQMKMRGPGKCCEKAPVIVQQSALRTDAVVVHPSVFTAVWLAEFEIVRSEDDKLNKFDRPEHSPPESPPTAITILRI